MSEIKKPIIEEIIDYLSVLIKKRFSDNVSAVYFGDIGMYLPSLFTGNNRKRMAVIAINPVSFDLVEGTRTALHEKRIIKLQIITFVNVIQDFKAIPSSEYGERMLVRVTSDLLLFLTNKSSERLDGKVLFMEVFDIDWDWRVTEDATLRGAAIEIDIQVNINRQQDI